MADSNAQLGITTNGDGDAVSSSSFPVQATPVVVDSVNDLDKDFGSVVATQVRRRSNRRKSAWFVPVGIGIGV